jgi:hypothetical protein
MRISEAIEMIRIYYLCMGYDFYDLRDLKGTFSGLPFNFCVALYNPKSDKTKLIYFYHYEQMLKWAVKNLDYPKPPNLYNLDIKRNLSKTHYLNGKATRKRII